MVYSYLSIVNMLVMMTFCLLTLYAVGHPKTVSKNLSNLMKLAFTCVSICFAIKLHQRIDGDPASIQDVFRDLSILFMSAVYMWDINKSDRKVGRDE